MNVKVPPDCLFYQAIELPGIGLIDGSWDHRETADDYLGHVDFSGRRVLDVGPANGFFSFEMERRGGEVTALDLGPEGDWDTVPQPYLESTFVVGNLRQNVQRAENAFWFAHRTLNSRVKLLYGSVYDTPALISQVDIGLMGNVLQHLRDPFRGIERVAQVVADTLIITEAVWYSDEAFLTMPAMRLIPNADSPYCNHSWWQVSPRLAMEILRLLGFPQLSLKFHEQRFVSSATDSEARWVTHFTVTGKRPCRLEDHTTSGGEVRVVFPDNAWYSEERGSVHRWRWSSESSSSVWIDNLGTRDDPVSIACGLASLQHDTIELRLNGSMVWSGPVVGYPTGVFTTSAALKPGRNILEFRATKPASRSAGDSRLLSFAVYDIALSKQLGWPSV